jgi:hypothetical protein
MYTTTRFFALLTLILTLLHPAYAWGSLAHRTVAYLSTLYTHHTTHRFTNALLHRQDISEAALFPDKIAHMPMFAYTRPWHYIDAQDSPPTQCSLNMTRDCALSSGCIVSALSNHTARVTNISLPFFLRSQSLRFVLHFMGDIHQPLHTEAEDRGGNLIPVVFDGKHTNLHSVWDTLIPNKHRKRDEWSDPRSRESEEEAAYLWALELYASDTKNDVDEECVKDAGECAFEWAEEVNQWVCEYVLKDDVDGVQGMDLGGEYYEGAREIVDAMVRKGGRRLAAWLDLMAEECEDEDWSDSVVVELVIQDEL